MKITRRKTPYLYFAPVLFYMLFFSVYPLMYSLYMSFTKFSLTSPEQIFIGLKNYAYIIHDQVFQAAVIQTLEFVSLAVALEFCIGFVLALILNQEFRGAKIFRFICIIPMMMMPAIIGFIWKFMYHGDIGIINYLLGLIGIRGPIWLGNSTTAIISIIITDVWQWTPFCFLVLLAGLQSLPVEPFEAAKIDGASRWETFKSITVPMLRPAIIVALLFRIIDSFKIFDYVYVMTQGGPGDATMVMSFYAYRWAFVFQDFGMASAASYLLLIIVSIFFIIFVNMTKLG